MTTHRTHLYQLCNRMGLSHKAVSLMQYGICISQGIGALIMVRLIGSKRILVFIPFFDTFHLRLHRLL